MSSQRPPSKTVAPRRQDIAMSIPKTRSYLYRIARLLGDIEAVRRGRVGRRIGRRITGRATGRALRKLFK